MSAAIPVLRLNGISKSFPGVKALSDVSLELYAGQVTALVGENGAGKSTIVKVLTGIYQPEAGVIEVDGAQVRKYIRAGPGSNQKIDLNCSMFDLS